MNDKNKRGGAQKAPFPAERKRSGGLMKVLPVLMIAAGVLMIAGVLAIKQYTARQQSTLIEQYRSGAYQSQPSPQATPGNDEQAPSATPESTPEAMLPDTEQMVELDQEEAPGPQQIKDDLANIKLLGVMSIPKIDLEVAVGEGVTNRTIRYAVGHFQQTALPGENGNFSVIGHRSYIMGEFFNRLDEVEIGDQVMVERDGMLYTYSVSDIMVVEPTDMWVLDSTPDPQITLITCTPIRIATHRLIVKGVLTDAYPLN
ncbi:MAG: class D sortase [Christensenellales bacterium]|jgi:sortase A